LLRLKRDRLVATASTTARSPARSPPQREELGAWWVACAGCRSSTSSYRTSCTGGRRSKAALRGQRFYAYLIDAIRRQIEADEAEDRETGRGQ
jgi:hypothetical protein